MRILNTLVLLCLLSCQVVAQLKVDAEQFIAITAKSARTEPLSDRVAVFLHERDAGEKTGVFLTITSSAKWATPYTHDSAVQLAPSKVNPGSWLMFAVPGKYKILVIEFDPISGPIFNNVDVTVGTSPPPIAPPITPPPGDFTEVTQASKDNADRLNDPPTRIALKAAYGLTIPLMNGKTYDECKTLVTAARFGAFNARAGASRDVDWESWKKAVDAELVKFVKVGDVAKYTQAIEAIVEGL